MEFAHQKTVSGEEIRQLRKKLDFTQKNFAAFANVSVKTVQHWESGKKEVSGPIVALLKILKEHPQLKDELMIPEKNYPLRLKYFCGNDLCTIIDVDERNQKIFVKNFVSDYMYRAFGRNEKPDYRDYEEFLESRCFPRTRDQMKLMLRELNFPFYDPFLIIQKTQGRMAEDNFWIQIEM